MTSETQLIEKFKFSALILRVKRIELDMDIDETPFLWCGNLSITSLIHLCLFLCEKISKEKVLMISRQHQNV